MSVPASVLELQGRCWPPARTSAPPFGSCWRDLSHYGVARKDRDDHGMTVYLEEFSAVSDGARATIDLAERLRDAGVGVVFVVQSYEGLGDEHHRLAATAWPARRAARVRPALRWGSPTSPSRPGGPRPRRCRGSCRGSGQRRRHR